LATVPVAGGSAPSAWRQAATDSEALTIIA